MTGIHRGDIRDNPEVVAHPSERVVQVLNGIEREVALFAGERLRCHSRRQRSWPRRAGEKRWKIGCRGWRIVKSSVSARGTRPDIARLESRTATYRLPRGKCEVGTCREAAEVRQDFGLVEGNSLEDEALEVRICPNPVGVITHVCVLILEI